MNQFLWYCEYTQILYKLFCIFQNINDMVAMERPDWQAVFTYVTAIYKHFEVDNKGSM